MRTIAQAARWIDETGLALLYPKGDYVLTSMYEAIAGHSDMDWEAPETWKVWEWKDELAAASRDARRAASPRRDGQAAR